MMVGVLIFMLIAIIGFCVAACNPKNLVAKEPPVLNIPERFRWKPKKFDSKLTFEEECHETNVVAFWFPFLISLFITGAWFSMEASILGLPLALFVSLFVGMIGMSVGHSVNIERAKDQGISDDDPTVQHEKLEKAMGTVLTTLTLADLLGKTKSSAKDVANVDGWKKMK